MKQDSAYTIYHIQVFATGPGGGNPWPVVLEAEHIPAARGQRLAQDDAAETVLVGGSTDPAADFRLRYFMPRYEM